VLRPITAPADGSTVTGVALVSVATGGVTGIRRIDLYVDGVREQADYRPPYLFAWAASEVPAGSHPLGDAGPHQRHHPALAEMHRADHRPMSGTGLR
jgi:hypothetical protein